MQSSKSKSKLSRNSAKKNPVRFNFEAIGTSWEIEINDFIFKESSEILLSKIKIQIDEFDKNYSRFRSDSLVSKMAANKGVFKLPNDAKPMFDFYEQMYKISGGSVTPLIGQTLADAGYDAQYSLKSKSTISKPGSWESALVYDFPSLRMKVPAILDFGAAGKGYLVDIISDLLKEQGVESFCIDAGGDILHKSIDDSQIKVGLEHPDNTGQVIGIVEINNKSICGSAGNRRKWGSFNHIIDPFSALSPKEIKAVWVVADTAMLADGLSTCLFFMPAADLIKYYTFEYALVRDNLSLEHSPGFPAEFF